MGSSIYSTATGGWLSVPLNNDDIQQYTEIHHYLNNFDNTKITVDIMINHIAITIITLSHSPNTDPQKNILCVFVSHCPLLCVYSLYSLQIVIVYILSKPVKFY